MAEPTADRAARRAHAGCAARSGSAIRARVTLLASLPAVIVLRGVRDQALEWFDVCRRHAGEATRGLVDDG